MKKIIYLLISVLILFTVIIGDFALGSEKPNDNARNSTFEYPLYGDPDYISDMDFYGLWNENTGTWQIKPLLNYERYPDLEPVEASVKEGEYEQAEYELLQYYREIKYQRSVPINSVSNEDITAADLLGKNFYFVQYNGAIVDTFNVENDWTEVSVNVTDSIKKAQGIEQYRTFMINSVSRTSIAEFMTKEGGHAPILRLNVNGAAREIPACRDTYIAAGTLANVNYGNETIMLASESGTVYNHDDGTKRPYVTFDISSLKSTDVISSASLLLQGRNISDTGTKEMVLYQYNDSNWDEGTLTWDTFTEHYTFSLNDQDSWDYITSASPSIKGKICFLHRGGILNIPGQLWDYTKDEQYAYTFLRQQMALVNHVGVNTNVMNPIDMATHLNAASRNVLQTVDSEYMSPEIFTALMKHFYLMAKWVVDDYYGVAENNYGSFATGGVYAIISRFRELTVYDSWLEATRVENSRLIAIFTLEDGTSVELASGYTHTLIGTLYTPLHIYTTINNSDLPFSDEDISQMAKMIKTFCYTMAPGFMSFNWGDDTTYTNQYVVEDAARWYKSILSGYNELEYFATSGKSGSSPPFTSIVLPYGLRTVMRSGWDDKAIALNIGAKGRGSHGHYDQLSIAMFGYGKFLITDQGFGAVLTGDIYSYMRSPQSHSMVVMNNKSQLSSQTDGASLGSELNSLYDFTSYSTPVVPDAMIQERSVLFDRSRKLFIVSDYIRPNDNSAQNEYVQYWHMLPTANLTIDSETYIARSNFEDVNVSITPVSPEKFSEATIEDAIFAPTAGSFQASKKAAYHKSGAGDMTYDTIIVPENIGERFRVETVAIDTGLPQGVANALYFDLYNEKTGSTERAYYYHLNDLTQKDEVTIGKYKTDATTMYVVENTSGKSPSVFLMNATYLKDSTLMDQYIIKSTVEIPSISIKTNGQVFEIISSVLENSDIKNITFYNYKKLTGAIINGYEEPAKLADGGYLYFGDSPIFSGTPDSGGDEEIPDNSDNSKKEPAHAGGSNNKSKGGGNSIVAPTPEPVVEPEKSVKSDNDRQLPTSIADELKNHWAKDEIAALYKAGIVNGDLGLRLSDNITRAEFTALVVRALGLQAVDGEEIPFSDIYLNDWYAPFIVVAEANGIIEGNGSIFRPNAYISREEMCKIIIAAYKIKNDKDVEINNKKLFADEQEISVWARRYVYEAEAAGLVMGMDDGTFQPNNNTLREQAFVVLWRLLEDKK